MSKQRWKEVWERRRDHRQDIYIAKTLKQPIVNYTNKSENSMKSSLILTYHTLNMIIHVEYWFFIKYIFAIDILCLLRVYVWTNVPILWSINVLLSATVWVILWYKFFNIFLISYWFLKFNWPSLNNSTRYSRTEEAFIKKSYSLQHKASVISFLDVILLLFVTYLAFSSNTNNHLYFS